MTILLLEDVERIVRSLIAELQDREDINQDIYNGVRCGLATFMVAVCEEVGDDEDVQMWFREATHYMRKIRGKQDER